MAEGVSLLEGTTVLKNEMRFLYYGEVVFVEVIMTLRCLQTQGSLGLNTCMLKYIVLMAVKSVNFI